MNNYLKLHYEMWDRIAHLIDAFQKDIILMDFDERYSNLEHYQNYLRGSYLCAIKRRIQEAMGYYDVTGRCFLCEHAGSVCEECAEYVGGNPMDWKSNCLGGLYYKFYKAEDWREQSKFAKEIRDLTKEEM